MFVQMKKTALSRIGNDMQFDIATFHPLSSLHSDVTGKQYDL